MQRRPLPAILLFLPVGAGWHFKMGGVHNKAQQLELQPNAGLWREERGLATSNRDMPQEMIQRGAFPLPVDVHVKVCVS